MVLLSLVSGLSTVVSEATPLVAMGAVGDAPLVLAALEVVVEEVGGDTLVLTGAVAWGGNLGVALETWAVVGEGVLTTSTSHPEGGGVLTTPTSRERFF